MKKLIFAAAVAAGMGAFALESANVVGYNGATSGSDNNFVTIPFSDIGYNTADIQQIKLSDGGAGGIGWGTETFAIWEGLPSPVVGSGFVYLDASMDPTAQATDYYWGDAEGNKAAYSIAAGQGIIINCAANLEISTSGEVSDDQIEFTTVQDNNFTGNPFPSDIDIQAIKISDGGAGTIGWGTETFAIWAGLPTAVVGSGFVYLDASMDPTAQATGYYWGDAEGNKATYPIAPGQGVVVNCAADLTVTIDAPFAL